MSLYLLNQVYSSLHANFVLFKRCKPQVIKQTLVLAALGIAINPPSLAESVLKNENSRRSLKVDSEEFMG